MGNEAKLQTFTFASDYVPAHYKWTGKELSSLGDCSATAEVIKKRLACMYHKRDIERELQKAKYEKLCEKIKNREITSMDEILTNKDWKSVYEQYCDNMRVLLRKYIHK